MSGRQMTEQHRAEKTGFDRRAFIERAAVVGARQDGARRGNGR
jgi:hypothetical protein